MNIRNPITYYDNIIPLKNQNFIENMLLGKIRGLSFPYYYTRNLTGVDDPNNPNPERGFGSLLYSHRDANIKEELSFQLLTPFYSLISQLDLIFKNSSLVIFCSGLYAFVNKIMFNNSDASLDNCILWIFEKRYFSWSPFEFDHKSILRS